jgi:filamentous hemagglutinin
LGNKAPIVQYDVYLDKVDGQLWIFKKGGQGMGIPTGGYKREGLNVKYIF